MSVVESAVRKRPEFVRSFLSDFSPPEIPPDPRLIVVAGLGSSAAGGIFAEPFSTYPVIVSRDSVLPRFVDDRDLVIVSSYSGNTAETIMSLRDAYNRNIRPVVLTSGGKLLEIAESLDLPIVRLKPAGYTSRAVVPVIIVATLAVINEVTRSFGRLDEVPEIIAGSLDDEEAEAIALRIGGKVVASIGYGPFKPAMRRIVAEFSENAKVPAFYKEIPEANHNYLMSVGHPGVANVYPEHERRTKLVPFSGRLNRKECVPIYVRNRGFLGNFEILTKAALASIKLARILGRDPDDISRLEELKKRFLEGIGF